MARALGSVRRLLAPSPLVLRALIIGLAVRLLLAPCTSYPYDAYPFYGAVVSSLAGTGPYGNVLFTYPPLFSAILFPFFWSVSQFMDPASFGAFVPAMIGVSRATGMIVPFVTSPAFNLLFKLPIIVGDALVALTLHRAVDRWKGREAADTAFLVWFLNPLVIFVSSVHGQFDALAAYCGLVGTLGFMDRRYLLSGLSLGLGVLLKLFPAYIILGLGVALLIQLHAALREGKRASALRPALAFLGGGALSLLTIAPLLLSSRSFLDYIVRRGTYSSVGGMNVWFAAPLLSGGDGTGGAGSGVPFNTILLLLGIALALLVAYLVLRKGCEGERPLLLSTAVLTVVMVTQAVTNPQHLLWLFPFLVMLSAAHPRMLPKMYALSILGLLYLLCLQSGFVFLYPLAQFTGLVSVEALNQGIEVFLIGTGGIRELVLSVLGGAGFLVLLTVPLPPRLDLMDRAISRIASRREGDEG